ncbi:hypothetical protein [Streptomyces sp. ISL-86]|uniref:hypothetical protein n=1 Tax=Streptomyces sp. ISL-86 TaxID=2819187 RepID=UPI001BEA5130|nr:hypothetical protein [Streptomyces sp. ISL-86]MBT2458000.1 hypothetical protein [Streptomyces sp. ISL-86]
MQRQSRWKRHGGARRTVLTTAVRAVTATTLAIGALTACSSDEEDLWYATDYGAHEPLAVVGYPSVDSLRIAQEVVWRMADANPGKLAALATPNTLDSAPEKTAENWITAFGKGARGKVTAEFYDEGSKRQTVVLYFHGTGQIKQLLVRGGMGGEEEGWHVYMTEADYAEATAVLPWVPKTPGALGSKSAAAPAG